jgi:type VI secretion system protein ImpM
MIQHGPIGLFGKIPAQGDFFRLHVGDPAAQALVSWLQDAIEPVYRARLPLPAVPVRFLFRAPGVGSALVGVLGASVDRVGRAFPLCAFVPVQVGAVARSFPVLPAAYRAFTDAAAALVADAATLDGAALGARAGSLPLPAPGAMATAEEAARRDAATEPLPAMLGRLFGDLPAGAAGYALGTFDAAARPVRGREPARATLALDCPAERDLDLWTWLELARRTLSWAAPPPFFWSPGIPGRIVISLGGPAPGLLAHLCDPARPGPRIWPLRTLQPAAIETARKGLAPALQRALDAPDGSVETFVAAATAR